MLPEAFGQRRRVTDPEPGDRGRPLQPGPADRADPEDVPSDPDAVALRRAAPLDRPPVDLAGETADLDVIPREEAEAGVELAAIELDAGVG